jgi:hypothetical protein
MHLDDLEIVFGVCGRNLARAPRALRTPEKAANLAGAGTGVHTYPVPGVLELPPVMVRPE